MNRKPGLAMALVAIELAACSGDSNINGGDGGGGDFAITGSDGGDGGGGDFAMPSRVDCTQYASAQCALLNQCAPQKLLQQYENTIICNSVLTKSCMDAQAAGDNGLADPAACAATVSGCDAYYALIQNISVPAACRKKDGAGGNQSPCKFDSQCTLGFYCYGTTTSPVPICQGACAQGVTPCKVDHDCDLNANKRCVASFVAGPPPSSDNTPICQTVAYGAQGAACVTGSNHQCQNGLGCDGNGACQPLLSTGASCDNVNQYLCDARKGDQCSPDPNNPTTKLCTALNVVAIGQPCGLVGSPPVQQNCSAYAICTGSPSKCQARAMLNQTCSASPDNCYPGLVCTSGTCQQAPPSQCK